jgi:hypothetical protein
MDTRKDMPPLKTPSPAKAWRMIETAPLNTLSGASR